ncbi:MAG: hypothetical protein EPN33_04555 [Acidobacteria bacterium]|nr:MAG: hypothetical protein EPN33_04555 [Acidobacteriota bacterium]
MPTLYVENVPADLYAALRARAREQRSSIAAETIRILREHVPTAAGLQRRRRAVAALLRLQRQTRPGPPSALELLRESRAEREEQLLTATRPRRRRQHD